MSNEKASAFAETSGLEYSAEFVPQSKSRNAKEKSPSINWRITLRKNGVELATDYMEGCAHLPHYQQRFANMVFYDDAVRSACEKGHSLLVPGPTAVAAYVGRKVQPPALTDVLYSLVMDADVLEYPDFVEWAECYGYEPDSRKAEAIYRACIELALKLRQMIDIDQAREAFQDY